MSLNNLKVRIDLTPDQSAHLQRVTGKHYGALELSVEELEERIAPTTGIKVPD